MSFTTTSANLTALGIVVSTTTSATSSPTVSPAFAATAFVTASGILDNLNTSTEVINDNDPRVTYTGAWVQEFHDNVTLHDAPQAGSSLTLDFFGSGIHVLGVVRVGPSPIIAQYTIDGNVSGAQTRQVSGSNANILDQEFYSILGLPLAQHNLAINVTEFVQNNTRLYTIDCFVVEKSGTAALPSRHKHPLGKRTIGAIVGSVVGTVVLAIILYFFIRWFRRARAKRGPDTIPRPLLVDVEGLRGEKPQSDVESVRNHVDLSTPEPRNYTDPWTRCFGFEFRRVHDM